MTVKLGALKGLEAFEIDDEGKPKTKTGIVANGAGEIAVRLEAGERSRLLPARQDQVLNVALEPGRRRAPAERHRLKPHERLQAIAILRGWACFAFGRVSVSTPSSRLALIFS